MYKKNYGNATALIERSNASASFVVDIDHKWKSKGGYEVSDL